MATVSIETSAISYLTARPSRDVLAAAHQQITREWWDQHRKRFEVFISPLVAEECQRGDACPEICTPEELMGGTEHD